ncbi:MAG: ribonuclease D [Proteobacteria bacterium]|nr:ribonuclease D [Pseudomonadota bacterium]
MPKLHFEPITRTDELRELCVRLNAAEFLTIDTEFVRTSTYYSQLCLIQVADDHDAYAIDALAPGLDLTPFYDLLNNGDPMMVFHACRQDLEIFYLASGKLPHRLFDTQVAGMVCGFGESVGYETLVKTMTNGKLDKAIRFTDWSRRPLSHKQLDYALGDVTYLRKIYRKLSAELEKNGRATWLEEEVAVLEDPRTYDMDVGDAWKRVKTRSSNRRFLARVRELATWRETEARRRDIPRNRVIRDEVLLQIAAHPPDNYNALKNVRALPKRYHANPDKAKDILAGLARAEALAEDQLPDPPKERRKADKMAAVLDLLKIFLKYRGNDSGVAPKLIASARDLEELVLGNREDLALLKGWRHELFGKDALALIEGKIALTAKGAKLKVAPLSPAE